jgi:hypothetical protein
MVTLDAHLPLQAFNSISLSLTQPSMLSKVVTVIGAQLSSTSGRATQIGQHCPSTYFNSSPASQLTLHDDFSFLHVTPVSASTHSHVTHSSSSQVSPKSLYSPWNSHICGTHLQHSSDPSFISRICPSGQDEILQILEHSASSLTHLQLWQESVVHTFFVE